MIDPRIARLPEIRYIYLDSTGANLYGIPYELRPGQSPRDLLRGKFPAAFPRGSLRSATPQDLGWIDLCGLVDFIAEIRRRGAIPDYPNEYRNLDCHPSVKPGDRIRLCPGCHDLDASFDNAEAVVRRVNEHNGNVYCDEPIGKVRSGAFYVLS